MECPEGHAQLVEISYKGVLIYECPTCKGRWFDRGELKKAKDRTDEDLRWLDFDPFGPEADKYAVPASTEQRLCPRCSLPMTALTYKTSGVTIYKCPRCHGVWLSHGEFEAIVSYLENVVDAESAPELAKDAGKQFEKVLVGPGGEISDIRDFFTVLKLLEMRLLVEHPRVAAAAEKIYQYSPLK